MRYRINAPQVTHQTIEGEAIILNLENGAYYSTEGIGVVIWEGAVQGATAEEIMAYLAQRYVGDPAAMADATTQFLAELQQEGLIVPAASDVVSAPAFPPSSSEPLAAFELPALSKYTDMQDLLLLDPIHEVDEQGWPFKKR
jgi:hypothetical protein